MTRNRYHFFVPFFKKLKTYKIYENLEFLI